MSAAKPFRELPLGDTLRPTIDRLKQIAAEAGDRLYLSDGPVQQDHALLDLTAEALRLLTRAKNIHAYRREAMHTYPTCERGWWTDAARSEDQKLVSEMRAAEAEAKQKLRRAAKIKATTPAGIYAKALLVKASADGAAVLAMSLADDFIACQPLRASLWPAEVAP